MNSWRAYLLPVVKLTAVSACLSAEMAGDKGWTKGTGVRWRELQVPASGWTHLTEVPASETGITFRSDIAEAKGVENSIRLAGTGVAAGDVDGDGLCDLFFCSMGGGSQLYRNLGNWRFEEVTEAAGVGFPGQELSGAVFSDIDGDGDLDLLVNSITGGTRLYLNDGKGHFSESLNSGLLRKYGSNSLALADVDGNGTLDLYVVNYAKTKIEDRPNTKIEVKTVNGKVLLAALDGIPATAPELTNRYVIDGEHTIREFGEPDVFYLNDGKGKFTPVPWNSGRFTDEHGRALKQPYFDWGLSAMFHDMNGDGAPDLYVCNDLFSPDRIWINDGHGNFHPIENSALRQTSLFSMGVDFADINGDGYEDFTVMDMLSPSLAEQKVQIVGVRSGFTAPGDLGFRPQYKHNTLFLNRGDGTFAEISQFSGVEATGWSWSPVFLDVDLDGYADLLVTAGYYRDALNVDAVAKMKSIRAGRKLSDAEYREVKKLFPALPQQNRVFRNRADLTFEDRSVDWGFNNFGISQAICLADLDGDGDLDVIVVRQNGPVAIYRNESAAPRVAVRLQGQAPNTHGIGAKIQFRGGPVLQTTEVTCGGRYLSCDDTTKCFATGNGARELELEVTWRSGRRSVIRGVRANRLYEVAEEGASDSPPIKAAPPMLFEDQSSLLGHKHKEKEYDDFARQPSLPHKLSQSGPSVNWCDLNGDGFEDLVISAGPDGGITIYENESGRSFKKLESPIFAGGKDQNILGMTTLPGRIFGAASSYEQSGMKAGAVWEYVPGRGSTVVISNAVPVCSALLFADFDGDGIPDLFAGGRVLPGKYPESTPSILYRGTAQGWEIDSRNSKSVAQAGLVTCAVASDLNGDGWPDLILACEWGPIRVFANRKGSLEEITGSLGLNAYAGWWNGVAVGDFDGDGRMDIVASNWGRNTRYERYRGHPLRLYYDQAGPIVVPILSVQDSTSGKYFPLTGLDRLRQVLPGLSERYATHAAVAAASTEEIFESVSMSAHLLEANLLESTIFLNRGDHFEARPLPAEAQLAPAFGMAVADFDGDGAEDVFLSQNYFEVDSETARYDGGRGLLLKGDGRGGFSAVPGQVSGLQIYGEQRGCAAADYDGDGRVDLVVPQNGAVTKLFRNRGARPGLRIRVVGADSKGLLGTTIRLMDSKGMGPARQIQTASGYLSQNSTVQVMNLAGATVLWVQWPGGQTNTFGLPADAREIIVTPRGVEARP